MRNPFTPAGLVLISILASLVSIVAMLVIIIFLLTK